MGILEIMLANWIRPGRQDNGYHYRVDRQLPTTRAVITRLAAAVAFLALTVLVLDNAGERYERQLATNAVAATRQ